MNLGQYKIFCKCRLKISYLLGVSFPKKKEKYTRLISLLWAFSSQKMFNDTSTDTFKVYTNFNEFITQYDFLKSR